MDWKLIALDLDGTLLDREGNVSDENAEWIGKAHASGITVALVSGRHRFRMTPIAQKLKLNAPMITTNGCEIWSADGRLIERNVLPWKAVEDIHRFAFQHGVSYRAYCAEGVFDSDRRQHLLQLDYSWLKVLLKSDNPQSIRELQSRLEQRGRVELIPYDTQQELAAVDVQPKGIGKANALRTLCGALGIDRSQVVAFGDDRNDIGMLKWAGLGVAMDNAAEEVKAAADAVAPHYLESGVGRAISRLMKGQPA